MGPPPAEAGKLTRRQVLARFGLGAVAAAAPLPFLAACAPDLRSAVPTPRPTATPDAILSRPRPPREKPVAEDMKEFNSFLPVRIDIPKDMTGSTEERDGIKMNVFRARRANWDVEHDVEIALYIDPYYQGDLLRYRETQIARLQRKGNVTFEIPSGVAFALTPTKQPIIFNWLINKDTPSQIATQIFLFAHQGRGWVVQGTGKPRLSHIDEIDTQRVAQSLVLP